MNDQRTPEDLYEGNPLYSSPPPDGEPLEAEPMDAPPPRPEAEPMPSGAAPAGDESDSGIPEMWRPELDGVEGDPAFAEGDMGGQDSRFKGALSRTNLVLFGVFLAGVAIVAFMSMRQGPQESNAANQAQQQRVDQAINNFLARQDGVSPQAANGGSDLIPPATGSKRDKPLDDLMADSDHLVKMFFNFTDKSQVPLEDLKTNPFRFGEEKTNSTSVTEEEAAAAETARRKAEEQAKRERIAKAKDDLANLKLQTIMASGNSSQAMINTSIVRVGDTVVGFKIEKIETQRVHLSRDGMEFTLEMSW